MKKIKVWQLLGILCILIIIVIGIIVVSCKHQTSDDIINNDIRDELIVTNTENDIEENTIEENVIDLTYTDMEGTTDADGYYTDYYASSIYRTFGQPWECAKAYKDGKEVDLSEVFQDTNNIGKLYIDEFGNYIDYIGYPDNKSESERYGTYLASAEKLKFTDNLGNSVERAYDSENKNIEYDYNGYNLTLKCGANLHVDNALEKYLIDEVVVDDEDNSNEDCGLSLYENNEFSFYIGYGAGLCGKYEITENTIICNADISYAMEGGTFYFPCKIVMKFEKDNTTVKLVDATNEKFADISTDSSYNNFNQLSSFLNKTYSIK